MKIKRDNSILPKGIESFITSSLQVAANQQRWNKAESTEDKLGLATSWVRLLARAGSDLFPEHGEVIWLSYAAGICHAIEQDDIFLKQMHSEWPRLETTGHVDLGFPVNPPVRNSNLTSTEVKKRIAQELSAFCLTDEHRNAMIEGLSVANNTSRKDEESLQREIESLPQDIRSWLLQFDSHSHLEKNRKHIELLASIEADSKLACSLAHNDISKKLPSWIERHASTPLEDGVSKTLLASIASEGVSRLSHALKNTLDSITRTASLSQVDTVSQAIRTSLAMPVGGDVRESMARSLSSTLCKDLIKASLVGAEHPQSRELIEPLPSGLPYPELAGIFSKVFAREAFVAFQAFKQGSASPTLMLDMLGAGMKAMEGFSEETEQQVFKIQFEEIFSLLAQRIVALPDWNNHGSQWSLISGVDLEKLSHRKSPDWYLSTIADMTIVDDILHALCHAKTVDDRMLDGALPWMERHIEAGTFNPAAMAILSRLAEAAASQLNVSAMTSINDWMVLHGGEPYRPIGLAEHRQLSSQQPDLPLDGSDIGSTADAWIDAVQALTAKAAYGSTMTDFQEDLIGAKGLMHAIFEANELQLVTPVDASLPKTKSRRISL